jgi:GNAT superfamily N-acetyltransferase
MFYGFDKNLNNYMEKDIKIRKAELKDIGDILRLNMELDKDEMEKYGLDWDLGWIYGKGKNVISEIIIDDDNFIMVAESGGGVVAFFRASLYNDDFDWMSRRKGRGAEIWDIFVEKNFRRKKIGKMFMESFLTWAKNKKINYILVGAADKNYKAIEYYKKFGFANDLLFLEKKII